MHWWDVIGVIADLIGIAGAVLSAMLWFRAQSLEQRLERAIRLPEFIEKVVTVRDSFRGALDQGLAADVVAAADSFRGLLEELFRLKVLEKSRLERLGSLDSLVSSKRVDESQNVELLFNQVIDKLRLEKDRSAWQLPSPAKHPQNSRRS